jgi:crotonobetainyl-CoA:carnitine CoA-transferase CaiB-like acyl-CoA transferase
LNEVFADEHINSRGMIHTWHHPKSDNVELVASPIKLSKTPVRKDLPPPLLGEHTAEVLQALLGVDAAALEELKRKKII